MHRLVLSVAALVASVQAAEIPVTEVQTTEVCQQAKLQRRPCTALVLGGGGARGGAHLGVIEQLEQQQIPVDLVVGTSIGAFIGGLYASGYSAAQIREKLANANWAQGFRDRVYRDEMPMRRKQHSDEFSINVDLGLSAEGIKLPQGLLFGQALADVLSSVYGAAANIEHFDQLAIPFRAVATDLLTQQQVVLQRGSLLQAVQASMTIPGVVAPMELDGQVLIDGGVVNNLPISVAKALGAEQVIAVSIDAPLLNKQQLGSALNVTQQLTAFLVRAGVQQQLALLTEQDLLLTPNASDVGTLEFDEMQQAIDAGRKAATAAVAKLSRYSQPAHYANWLKQHSRQSPAAVRIDSIALDNQSRLDDALLLQRLALQPGDEYRSRTVHQGLRQLYGLDTFERITEQLTTDANGGHQLQLRAEEKSWGPGYLNFRLQLEDDFRNTHQYQIAGAFTLTNLSGWGAEWHTELALGSNKYLYTELYWPFSNSPFYALTAAGHRRDVQPIQDEQGLSNGEYRNSRNFAKAELGWNISDHAVISLGQRYQNGGITLTAELAESFGANNIDYSSDATELRLIWDTLDSRSFPTRGIRLDTLYSRSLDKTLTLSGYRNRLALELLLAKSWQRHVLRTRWSLNQNDMDDTAISFDQASLGGFLNLSGYPADLLYGSDIQYGSLIYLYQLNQQHLSFFNAPLFFGASIERGRVKTNIFDQQTADDTTDWLWAGSVFLGWDTPIGPLYLGLGQAERSFIRQNRSVYLSFGKFY